jgi:hypothetical protein
VSTSTPGAAIDEASATVRGYCAAVGSLGQLATFIAVVEGIKPVMDDWVSLEQLPNFEKLLVELSLSYRLGPIFEPIAAADARTIVGGEQFNTTRAQVGMADRGRIQVFLGRDEQHVDEAARSGWYNLAVAGRVVLKPWIDHHWFGLALGYPPCCLRAFAADGGWDLTNPYALATARTNGIARALCNPVMRHSGLSFITHYPCSFDCERSAQYAARVRQCLLRHAPSIAEQADRNVAAPYLLLSGWAAFGFEGQIAGQRIDYSSFWTAPTNNPNTELGRLLSEGDAVEITANIIRVIAGDELVGTYEARSDHYVPELPVLVDFGGPLDEC